MKKSNLAYHSRFYENRKGGLMQNEWGKSFCPPKTIDVRKMAKWEESGGMKEGKRKRKESLREKERGRKRNKERLNLGRARSPKEDLCFEKKSENWKIKSWREE